MSSLDTSVSGVMDSLGDTWYIFSRLEYDDYILGDTPK